MNRFTLTAIFFSILLICTARSQYLPVNPNATAKSKQLLSELYSSSGQGKILSGLHHRGNAEFDLQRIDSASGKVPVVWGGELAWNGKQTIDDATEAYKEGHIITLMWHAPRPFDTGTVSFRGMTLGKFSDNEWEELLSEGSEMYNLWLKQIDSIAVNFLKPLKDRDIPVLWRPYHEMNGEWFWWGNRQGENGFKLLYRRMWDRYVNYHHLDNILWVWNANGPRNIPGDTAYEYEPFYPGGEYVDVLATDIYNHDWKQSHHDGLIELGKGKLIALGEIGNLPSSEKLDSMNRFAWFMIWNGFTADKYNTIDQIRSVFCRPNTISLQDVAKH